MRAFAEQGGYDIDAGRDFMAVGAGSILSGLVGSFPVDASPPRTGAVVTAGGRTQAGALGAAAAMLLLLPVAGVLKDLPLSMLAAVLMFVAYRLFKWRDPRHRRPLPTVSSSRWPRSRSLVVVLIGVEQGIAAAVVLALLDRIRLTARPQLHVMGRVAGTTSWAPLSADVDAAPMPRVLVVLFATPLWYANAARAEWSSRRGGGRRPRRGEAPRDDVVDLAVGPPAGPGAADDSGSASPA